jgi:heme O synthase-like polyprenyltransferase
MGLTRHETTRLYHQHHREDRMKAALAIAAYSDRLAQRTFRYSILYLTLLFAALLVDHYLTPWIG